MTFAKKVIDVTIALGKGQFGNQPNSDVVTLHGYRVVLNMTAYFGSTQGQLQCKVYGLPLDMMAQLTTIGPINGQIRAANKISISVGDVDNALTTIFNGTIYTAWADLQESPNACLNVISLSPGDIAITPVGATSFKGPQSVETICTQIINNINSACPGQQMTLVNNGVDVHLSDVYLPGAGLNQIKLLAQAGKFSYRIDSTGSGGMSSNTLVISPNGQYTNDPVITLTPHSDPGLVGYPTFSSDGVIVKSTFANIRQSQKVLIRDSIITQANDSWQAQNITHQLESERPGGAWFTQFLGTRTFN